ncbi:MAG: hypothetical protein C6W57_01805 [Caldibacillus debilis]|nr:MAG: hypothetical protein C6W57_01805 [Caldibacillus debilis]REJ30046.1 MAG: hypothetical protein C6W56_04170 [Caldibacillus debilis]
MENALSRTEAKAPAGQTGTSAAGACTKRNFLQGKIGFNFAGKGIFPRKDGFNLKKREDFSQKIRFEPEEKTKFLPEKDLSQGARTWASPEKRKARPREKVPFPPAKSLSRCGEGPPLKKRVPLKAEPEHLFPAGGQGQA